MVAARLSEDPDCRVLLIEAGGREPIGSQVPLCFNMYRNSAISWNYPTKANGKSYLATLGGAARWPRGKVLGGSSAINGMMYLRGNRADYDRWRDCGNVGWDYASVLPYFRRSEANAQYAELNATYHGRAGPMHVERTFESPLDRALMRAATVELGYPELSDFNGHEQAGFGRLQLTTERGVRQSAARAFLGQAHGRRNLHVWLNTRVAKVCIDRRSRRAFGVETIAMATGRRRTVRARAEVIVCGGVVESPKLLLLSGIGAGEDLRQVRRGGWSFHFCRES